MRCPIHSRGLTFFPTAHVIGELWLPLIDVVESSGVITRFQCGDVQRSEIAALRIARIEAIGLATELRQGRPNLDTY